MEQTDLSGSGVTGEVTSSGGVHQRLDERLATLENNVYGTLLGATSPPDVVDRLRRNGWSARKASWLQYECAVDWCEVLLTPTEGAELNLSGVVDPDRLDHLADALAQVGLSGHLELYDADDRLTRTLPVAPPPVRT